MAHEHTAHHFDADAEYQETPGSSYEHTDAEPKSIIQFGIWIAVIAVFVHVLLGVAFEVGIRLTNTGAELRYPLAAGSQAAQPPEPRLQQFPRTDMYVQWQKDQAELTTYGWVDKSKNRVHIPIDDAIRLTLERGLPSRATGEGTGETPGLMGSDSSSGRVLERRRQ